LCAVVVQKKNQRKKRVPPFFACAVLCVCCAKKIIIKFETRRETEKNAEKQKTGNEVQWAEDKPLDDTNHVRAPPVFVEMCKCVAVLAWRCAKRRKKKGWCFKQDGCSVAGVGAKKNWNKERQYARHKEKNHSLPCTHTNQTSFKKTECSEPQPQNKNQKEKQ